MADSIDLKLTDTAKQIAENKDSQKVKKEGATGGSGGGGDNALAAFESRLLLRGPGSRRTEQELILEEIKVVAKNIQASSAESLSELAEIKNQLANNPPVVVVGIP
jgi:hypothetical protein